MERTAQRGRSRLWLVVAALHLMACTTTGYIPLAKNKPDQTILGVVKKGGERINFSDETAFLARDTLFAVNGRDSLRIPADSIKYLFARRPSPGKTWGLVGGLVGGALIVMLVVETQRSMQTAYAGPQ